MKNKYQESGNMSLANSAEVNPSERAEKLEKIRRIKKYFGWNNEDIARMLNSTPKNIKSRLAPSAKQNLPVWVNAMIGMFEACNKSDFPAAAVPDCG